MSAVWQAVHGERLVQVYSDAEPDRTAFTDLASAEATAALIDLIRAGRSEIPTQLVDSETWAQVEVAAGGATATIEDCVLVATRSEADADAEPTVRSQVWTGTAVETAEGWVIDRIAPGVAECVPPQLDQELLEAYRAYHEAWTAAWDPPDPDHPQLEQTMTGDRLEGIRELLAADQAAGVAFRDPHDPLENAVVFELGIGEATVSDCHEAHPDYGAYDVESGERLDDEIPPVEPGQLNLTSVDLVRTDDGEWKVFEAAGLRDTNCEPGGTRYVVAP